MLKQNCSFFNAEEICAIIPIYDTDASNATQIYLSDGSSFIVSCPVKKFIPTMLRYHHIHLGALGDWVYHAIGAKSCFPIVVSPEIVFVPFHTRSNTVGQDGVSGYVRHSFISSVLKDRIYLSNDLSFPLLSSIKSLKAKIKEGHYLSLLFTQGMDKNNFFTQHIPFIEPPFKVRKEKMRAEL